ncbi:hypothetical protein GCM10020331_022260 [Ectobacillus funiculus]
MNEAMVGTKTMVVSPHYLASAAGQRIFTKKGGNAFDAAVAVSACLAVVYPHMTGLGGEIHSGCCTIRRIIRREHIMAAGDQGIR